MPHELNKNAHPAPAFLRAEAMGLCARATEAELSGAIAGVVEELAVSELRPPETGLIMLRARIGGAGNAFNVGEATVTRAAVRVNGRTGVAHVLGRSHERARLAAIVDALAQDAEMRERIDNALFAPVRERLARQQRETAGKAAATRVDFFTLVRGED